MQPSDLNSDGVVDVIDLSILVSRWGTSDVTADINGDGIVDALDLSVLVSNWGAVSSSFTALLVTADGTLNTGATNLRNILSDEGYSVVVRGLSEPEDYSGIDVVVMSYGNPGGDNGTYMHPPVGIVGVDTWRPIGMGTNLGFENNTNPVEVVDAASPLAAGVSGTFDAYTSPAYITWETDLSASPDIVVTRPSQPAQAVVFAYEAGSSMPGRYATTRHVALGYHLNGFAVGITSEARAQLLAALSWARSTSYVAPPPPSAPTNLNATAGDMQVSLSWNSVAGATSYSVKRSTTSGGPYSTIVSGHTSASYTNTGLTNGTTYYYVVSATNAQGESPNSTQASATPVEGGSGGGSNLALLATSEEVAMWQDRAQNGPFRVAGDFSANSPGHWSEMQSCMGLNFSGARWAGPQELNANGSVKNMHELSTGLENDPPTNLRQMAHDMMSAAYAAMVTNNTSVAQAITNEIAYQATRPRLDYSNRTLWPFNHYNDVNPLFMHALWVKDYVLAYAVTKAMGFSSATVEKWFLDLAELNEQIVHANLASPFPNRKSNSYSSRASFVNNDVSWASHRLSDGTIIYFPLIMAYYSNRRSQQAGLVGLVGALLDNSYYIGEFKRFMREYVMFGSRLGPYGGFGDNNRGSSSFPQLGFSYLVHGMEGCLPAMEALARRGDTDLYEFSSSEGVDHPTWGTKYFKTMEQCLDMHLKFISRDWPLQYTSSGNPPPSSVAGDQNYLVGSRNFMAGREIINDANYLHAACYYNRQDWQDIILRVGTPSGFTSGVQGVGNIYNNWREDWRNRFLRSLDANPYS
jgi:hypothetical protein